jgi:hypothetical protein
MEQGNKSEHVNEVFGKMDALSKEFSLLEKLDNFLDTLQHQQSLNDERLLVIDGLITMFLTKQQTEPQLYYSLREQLILTETEEVVQNVIAETKRYLQEVLGDKATGVASAPTDVLSSLKSRLTTSTSIAPAVRELPPAPKPAAPTTPSGKPKLDPYRELV